MIDWTAVGGGVGMIITGVISMTKSVLHEMKIRSEEKKIATLLVGLG